MDLSQYKDLFVTEARQYLQGMKTALDGLDKNPACKDSLGALYLTAHSMKGMAMSMEFTQIAQLSAGLEHLADRCRSADLRYDPSAGAVFREGAKALDLLVDAVQKKAPYEGDLAPLLDRIHALLAPPEFKL